MKEIKFAPIRLTDEKTVQAHYDAADKIVDSLNKARQTYIDMFGTFDINVFVELFEQKKPFHLKRIAVEEYLKVKEINTGDIDLNKAIDLGLVKLPDFGKLYDDLLAVKTTLGWNHNSYLGSIIDLFDYKLQRFVKLSETEDNPVKKKIDEMFVINTQNEQENEFIRDIENLAHLHHKLIHQYKIISEKDLPGMPFSLSDVNDPEDLVHIPPSTLKKYRNQLAAKKTAKHILA